MFTQIKMFFTLLLVVGLAGAGVYVMKLRSDNAILKVNQQQLETAIADQSKVLEQQKKDLQIAHENCGHPTAKDFARLLRRGNARPEIASWVAKHFKCPACESNQRPKARRPTAVPKTYRFNHVVGIDLVSKDFEGVEYYWLNVVCWGTGYQMVYLVQGDGTKTPKNVWETLVDSWIRIFGMPEMLSLIHI